GAANLIERVITGQQLPAPFPSTFVRLGNAAPGDVKVVGPDNSTNGGVYYIVFKGSLANTDVPTMTAQINAGTPGALASSAGFPAAAVPAPGTISDGAGNEVQTVAFGSDIPGGTYALVLADQVTAFLPNNAAAPAVEAALAALPMVGAGNVR